MTVYQAKRLGHRELQHAGLARPGAAGDRGDHAVADLPGAGLPRRRPRLQRDGHRASTRRWPSATGCRSWSPASSRWTSWRASGAPCTSSRSGEHAVENAYPRAVPRRGQPGGAGRCSRTCSRSPTAAWRGIGMIPDSGWRLSPKYREFDAEHRFDGHRHRHRRSRRSAAAARCCRGCIKPHECAAFGTLCTPRNPLGATMVSSEGACAAYYLYRRLGRPTAGRDP